MAWSATWSELKAERATPRPQTSVLKESIHYVRKKENPFVLLLLPLLRFDSPALPVQPFAEQAASMFQEFFLPTVFHYSAFLPLQTLLLH